MLARKDGGSGRGYVPPVDRANGVVLRGSSRPRTLSCISFLSWLTTTAQSTNDAFPFDFRMVPKVDEQPQSHVRRLQIVVDLSSEFVGQLGDSFDFHDDLVEAFFETLESLAAPLVWVSLCQNCFQRFRRQRTEPTYS